MKKSFLILLSITLFFTACGKKNCCIIPTDSFFITAEKNSTQWAANPASSNAQHDTIAIFGSNFSSQLEETLTLQFKASVPGKYILKGRQALYYNTIGGDVVVSEYELDDTFSNTVEITTFNSGARTIGGTFNLKFKHSYPADKPASLQFLNGLFKIKLQN